MESKDDSESKQSEKWLLPVLICLIGAFMSTLDSSIVNVALSTIKQVFNTDMSTIEWVVTIYSLTLGIVVPLSGWLGDKLGFKRLYIIALGIFTVGSLLCTLSWNIYSLIVTRVIQAIGGGLIMPTAMSMIKRIVPRKNYGVAMGIYGVAMLMGPALGPTLGGYLVEYVDWRWIFTINLPVGILGLFAAGLFLPEFPPKKTEKLDLAGAFTCATMLFCLLFALSKGADWGWTSESIVLFFYVSIVALILLIFLELTAKNPIIELRLFRYRAFTLANIISMTVTVGLYSVIYYVPIFLQSIRGMGAMETGMLLLPGALISGIMMPISGTIYDKVGPRIMAIFGLTFVAATTYLFHSIDISTPTQLIVLWNGMRYFGMAFAQMPAGTASMEAVPIKLASKASTISNIVTRVSSSFGIAVLTSIMNNKDNFYAIQMRNNITEASIGVNQFLSSLSSDYGGVIIDVKEIGMQCIQKLILQTAFVRALDDIFIIATCVTLVSVIPALFLKRGVQKDG